MLTLYTKNNCGYCLQAKALLNNNDIPYMEVNVDNEPLALEFLVGEGHRTMPQIYPNGKLFVEGGFTGLSTMGADAIKEELSRVSIDVHSLGSL